MACNWLMMTSSAAHPRRFGYSHRQNYKKKNKPKAKQETAQPTAARFNKPKAEQETAQPTAARFKKPKAILEPRPPSAARLITEPLRALSLVDRRV